MRISDWSSDVCSSDLVGRTQRVPPRAEFAEDQDAHVLRAQAAQTGELELLRAGAVGPEAAGGHHGQLGHAAPSGRGGWSRSVFFSSLHLPYKGRCSEEKKT